MVTALKLAADIKKFGLGAVVFAATVSTAYGQRDLSEIAGSVDETGTAFGAAAWTILALLGFIMCGAGIIKIVKAKENREPLGTGIGMAVGGAILAALPFMIGAISLTAFGEDASGLDRLDLE